MTPVGVHPAADDIVFLVTGIGLFLAGSLPLIARYRSVSTAMGFVAVGVVAGLLPVPMPNVLPGPNEELIERLTEVTVIVALMGAGLAIDRRPGWRSWSSTWRLLAIAMPLCIGAVALLGWGLMGLSPAAALLLGAVLAPTDPVLAADVQVGAPAHEDEDDDEHEVRFALTSEAGLNDGLAFPFVYAAIFLAGTQTGTGDVGSWIGRWLAWELFGKVVLAVLVGIVVGRLTARLVFGAPRPWLRLAESNEGIVALAASFVGYGLAEAVGGWGFVAVFVTAVTIRGHESRSGYHRELHRFTHEVERLLTLAALLMFGVACATGLLSDLTWRGALVAALLVLVVRPGCGMLSLLGGQGPRRERAATGFFGVRGIGSFYYLAYAVGEAPFPEQDELWSTVAATVLFSVILHGGTTTVVMDRLDEASTDTPR
ncbi:MAG: cation:proton antiporter [Actinomycetota bacterium]|nr:cation:proton antiporter [Actinomycetota bacterium]